MRGLYPKCSQVWPDLYTIFCGFNREPAECLSCRTCIGQFVLLPGLTAPLEIQVVAGQLDHRSFCSTEPSALFTENSADVAVGQVSDKWTKQRCAQNKGTK